MKIAINTRFLLKDKLEGIGWFTHETVKRMVTQHPNDEFVFLFDRPFDESFIYSDNITPKVINPPARHPFLWYLWFEWAVPFALKKEKPDLFLSTDGYASLSTNIPTTLVIHDLAFEHHPKDVGGLVKSYYKHYTPKYAQKAQRLATVSEYTKNDVVAQYGVDPETIDVVYNGCNPLYQPVSDIVQEQTRQEYTQGKKYFLYVGAMHPRKNIGNLFKAFDYFKKNNDSDAVLLMVGRKAWGTAEIEEVYENMEYKKDVIFTGRVSSSVLKNILASALALTYIPYFEGFGIPIVEAQYSNTPVITSNLTSMPEVAGEGAHLIDPFSIDSIAGALQKIALDDEYREGLKQKGMINCQNFTWQKSADALWDCMMKTLRK
ncbi:MAG: glycosyltransferase family 4 protein [Cytophagales bacterium]|nr:glycosyltransferase family 4 protein [Cytophagales bacterium]